MIFIISDIHGEITKLKNLLEYIEKKDNFAELVFIGDYIDKGEDSAKTLNFISILDETKKCTFLIGNHEYSWLNATNSRQDLIAYLEKYGGLATAKSYSQNSILNARNIILEKHSAFFDKMISYHCVKNYFITHSGIPPEYFNTNPELIPLEKFLYNRYDFIAHQEYYLNNFKIIFGHTGFYKPYVDNYKIGIDTAACYLEEQPITSFCIDDQTFLNSFGETYSIQDFSFDFCYNIVRTDPWRIAKEIN